MKLETICLVGVAAGVFALTVGLFEGRTWVAVMGAVGAYTAAGVYRWSIRRREKGAEQ